jgi:hypothetical protein
MPKTLTGTKSDLVVNFAHSDFPSGSSTSLSVERLGERCALARSVANKKVARTKIALLLFIGRQTTKIFRRASSCVFTTDSCINVAPPRNLIFFGFYLSFAHNFFNYRCFQAASDFVRVARTVGTTKWRAMQGKSGHSSTRGFAKYRQLAADALVALAIGFLTIGFAPPAQALPSFARQTGQPCGTCHTDFPALTPYGRKFQAARI